MTEGEEKRGLWMVKGSKSRDFLLRRKSRLLSYKFTGDEVGEFKGVADIILPFLEERWDSNKNA